MLVSIGFQQQHVDDHSHTTDVNSNTSHLRRRQQRVYSVEGMYQIGYVIGTWFLMSDLPIALRCQRR